MDDEADLVVEGDDDALADAVEVSDPGGLGGFERGIERAEERDAADAGGVERGPDEPRAEQVEVEADVGEFGYE